MYKDPEAQKRAKRDWARKKRGKVPQGSINVEPEGVGVEPKIEPCVEPKVEPEASSGAISRVEKRQDGLDARVTAIETELVGIEERLAGLLNSLETRGMVVGGGGHRKSANDDESPFSKHRQTEG